MYSFKKNKKLKKNKKMLVPGLIIVAILLVVGVVIWQKNHSKSAVAPSASSETKGEPESTPNSTEGSSDTTAPSNQPGDNKNSTGSTSTNAVLIAPSGNFVSNHTPSLADNKTQTSVCNTTPGASCQITFTKDGVTKSLATQTTDRGGSTYWSWEPQSIGLSEGSWQIQAIATLNGKTLTANDALNLEVGP